ncbi:FMN-binding protein [Streptomyces sp. NPDC046716]|uniref:FMN-binding protein n=1 Tax=Streptomyces sp. NPDC046716 TaxID=3157093 RepID=UPI0033DABDBE
MKRAVPVVAFSIVGLISVWRYEPSFGSTEATAEPTPTASSSPSASEDSSGAKGSASTEEVKGTTVMTEKGPVEVQVTFTGDRITAVKMLQQPNHPQTEAAVPQLVAATLEAQSADVDTVTGATITSDAYKESLQAALDAKGA